MVLFTALFAQGRDLFCEFLVASPEADRLNTSG
jgi:hypothetical protein